MMQLMSNLIYDKIFKKNIYKKAPKGAFPPKVFYYFFSNNFFNLKRTTKFIYNSQKKQYFDISDF